MVTPPSKNRDQSDHSENLSAVIRSDNLRTGTVFTRVELLCVVFISVLVLKQKLGCILYMGMLKKYLSPCQK